MEKVAVRTLFRQTRRYHLTKYNLHAFLNATSCFEYPFIEFQSILTNVDGRI